MQLSTSDGKKKLFNEINITPLTDIFLVLLIIMMVIAPSFQSLDTDINIPEINSGIAIEQKNATISVTKRGQYYVNGKQVEADNLTAELTQLKPSLEKAEVVVKADTDAKSSEILKIMKAAQEAEYEKLVVAGEPLTKKEQRELEKNVQTNVVNNEDIKQEQVPDYNWDE